MKPKYYLYVDETHYHNLSMECLVMVKSFYQHEDWSLSHEKVGSTMQIMIYNEQQVTLCFLDESMQVQVELEFEALISCMADYSEPLRSHFKHLDLRYITKISLYRLLSKITGKELPWGILQGIRPVKLLFKLHQEFHRFYPSQAFIDSQQWIETVFTHIYCVSHEMAQLAFRIGKNELAYLPKSVEEARQSFSVYVSIPFCPTRCHYCSFPSNSIMQYKEYVDEYISCLTQEMTLVLAPMLKVRRISSLYIGGGTPTSLTASQLDTLLNHMDALIGLHYIQEITVEAGRPDTITLEKLEVLKKHGVHRISINPQSMNQTTLDCIGRKHSVEAILTAYELAQKVGFDRINMDIILGLPNETLDDVKKTLDSILALGPSEVTVHTLAIKRASLVHEHPSQYVLPSDAETTSMLEESWKALMGRGKYEPYYLYRQKNMVVSHENVGYFKGSAPCIYNIEIMEEVRPIIAFGAGGVSKEIDSDGAILRSENVKNLFDYQHRYKEMAQRKLTLYSLGVDEPFL